MCMSTIFYLQVYPLIRMQSRLRCRPPLLQSLKRSPPNRPQSPLRPSILPFLHNQHPNGRSSHCHWTLFPPLSAGLLREPLSGTGGASIAGVYSPDVFPHAMTSWVLCIFCAPAIGTLVSGFAIPVLGWRFSMWEILMSAAPVFGLILLFLPETSPATILYRRARRLEKLARHMHDGEGTSFQTVIRESLLILQNNLPRPGSSIPQLLHLPHLQNLLFFLRGIPHRLPRHVQIQPRTDGSSLPHHRSRDDHLICHIQHLHPQSPRPQIQIRKHRQQARKRISPSPRSSHVSAHPLACSYLAGQHGRKSTGSCPHWESSSTLPACSS